MDGEMVSSVAASLAASILGLVLILVRAARRPPNTRLSPYLVRAGAFLLALVAAVALAASRSFQPPLVVCILGLLVFGWLGWPNPNTQSAPLRQQLWAPPWGAAALVLAGAALIWFTAGEVICRTPDCVLSRRAAAAAASPKVIYVGNAGELTDVALPLIKADSAHHDLGRASHPQVYEIPAGDGFVLDTRGLPLLVPAEMDLPGPNRVFLTVRGIVYQLEWDASRAVYVLSGDTLRPWVQNDPPFTGLKAEQNVTIAIGYWDEGGVSTGQEQFVAMWTASGLVR